MLLASFWGLSAVIRNYQLSELVTSGKIPYGPLPDISSDHYSYNSLESAFNSHLDLKRANEFSKAQFESLILDSLEPAAREKFKKYLAPTLNLSVDYQMDPFWIISVMMVESGFNFKAQSFKNARGLMQIRPETASHLYQLMRKRISDEQLHSNLHKPSENIEVGVFYLKKLLHNFRMNYRLATIAYNIGPNKLKNLLDIEEIDTANFSYYLKVQESYGILAKKFASELKSRPRPFEMTYVVLGQGQILEDRLLRLYTQTLPDLTGESARTSENLQDLSAKSFIF